LLERCILLVGGWGVEKGMGGLFKVQGWASRLNNLDAALRHIVLTGSDTTTLFSRGPTVLYFVITGDVDF